MEAKNREAYQVRDKIATGKLTPGALGNSTPVYPDAVRRGDIFPIFFRIFSQHSLLSTHVRETKQMPGHIDVCIYTNDPFLILSIANDQI